MNFPLHLQTLRINQTDIKLFVPDIEAIQLAYSSQLIAFPYWSRVWPASIALTEFIISNHQLVQNKNLLELGAGLGLPSLVASKYANSVLCSDKDADAVEIIARSAKENNLDNMQAAMIDWEAVQIETAVDVLLLSDVNYEPEIFAKLTELIFQFLSHKTTIFLATPQRLMAKSFIQPLLKFRTHQQEISVTHNQEQTPITILVLQKK
jgi:predicted nicotinamide N-methyase